MKQSPFGAPVPYASCRQRQRFPTGTGSVAGVVGSSYVMPTQTWPAAHSASWAHGAHVAVAPPAGAQVEESARQTPLAHAVRSVAVHCTHVLDAVLQIVVPVRCVQSALAAHGMHVCAVASHRDIPTAVHCALSTHATQAWLVGSQCGVVPEQSLSPVQPTQVSVAPLARQCGVAPVHAPLHGTCASSAASRPASPASTPLSTPPSFASTHVECVASNT